MNLLVGAVDFQEMPDLEALVVTLAQYPNGEGWNISIQAPLSVSKQDIALGQDTYAIATSDGVIHYGELSPGIIQMI